MNPLLNIILDYYDGPLRGFMRIDNDHFLFKLLAWDERQDFRIFSLTKVPSDTFLVITTLLKTCGEATSSSWFPQLAALPEVTRDEIKKVMNEVQGNESMIVGSDDGLKTFLVTLILTEENLPIYNSLNTRNPKPNFEEWKQFLYKVVQPS